MTPGTNQEFSNTLLGKWVRKFLRLAEMIGVTTPTN